MPWKDKSKYETEEYLEYKRDYQRAWHQEHKTKRNAKVYERRDKLREFYRQFKENSVCVQCGESHPAALHFHHRNPKEKDFNLAEMIRDGYGIERIKREIEKCVVLCANCHAKYHYDSDPKHLSTSSSLADQIRELEQITSTDQKENFTEPLCDRLSLIHI